MADLKQYGTKFGFLSGSTLKIIACIAMFVDHFGLVIYPDDKVYRMIGRLAFPIFAYFIAEGSRYTRKKLKHFMLIFSVGVVYLLFYYFFADMIYPSIFLTFSFSILIIYLMDFLKKFVISDFKVWKLVVSILIFASALALSYIPFSLVVFDYGYLGMLAPVVISLFDFKDYEVPEKIRAFDSYPVRLISLSVILVLLAIRNNVMQFLVFGLELSIQYLSLLALIPLAFYNGRVGNKKLKYFFYAFYPLHLGVIMLIAIIMEFVK